MALQKQLKLARSIGPGKIDALVPKKLLLHLRQFLLRRLDLSDNQRDLLGNERDVLVGMLSWVGLILWRRCEGVESEKIGGDNRESIRTFTAEEHSEALLNLAVPSPIFRETEPISAPLCFCWCSALQRESEERESRGSDL